MHIKLIFIFGSHELLIWVVGKSYITYLSYMSRRAPVVPTPSVLPVRRSDADVSLTRRAYFLIFRIVPKVLFLDDFISSSKKKIG